MQYIIEHFPSTRTRHYAEWILQMALNPFQGPKEPRLGEVMQLSQSHTVPEGQSWDSNPAPPDAKAYALGCFFIFPLATCGSHFFTVPAFSALRSRFGFVSVPPSHAVVDIKHSST